MVAVVLFAAIPGYSVIGPDVLFQHAPVPLPEKLGPDTILTCNCPDHGLPAPLKFFCIHRKSASQFWRNVSIAVWTEVEVIWLSYWI